MATLIDSYSETNQDDSVDIGYLLETTYQQMAQSFTGVAGRLHSCKFYLKNTTSDTSNLTAVLYATQYDFGTTSRPTGSPLATSNVVDASTITTSFQLVTFTFSEVYTLEAGVKYAICLSHPSGSGHVIAVGVDSSTPSHAGNLSTYAEAWETFYPTQIDACFYVYTAESSVTGVSSITGISSITF